MDKKESIIKTMESLRPIIDRYSIPLPAIVQIVRWLGVTDSNCKLISEATLVNKECGLTPRQLLEQRNELLKACVSSVEQLKYELGEIGHDPSVGIDASDIIRAIETAELAIKKAYKPNQ